MTKKEVPRRHYCSVKQGPQRSFGPDILTERARLIIVNDKKWVNGTILHYYFFDKNTDGQYIYYNNGQREWRSWKGSSREEDVVRRAFDQWMNTGIGLVFKEVDNREDAEVRIGFMEGDGAWSYVGRDILQVPADERTMNFGWDIVNARDGIDVALHEIGHTMGFPHEHQNPFAGIIWDEDKVYESLAGPPNYWPREITYRNILRKINPDEVQGSNWDPDSIMHYPFDRGLIIEPEEYQRGLDPEPGLSERDISWARHFYPPIEDPDAPPQLELMTSYTFNIKPSEQRDFVFIAPSSRYFTFGTFGKMDTVMVLFEERDGELKYLSGDDDSGKDYNAKIMKRLSKGRKYVIRLRLYFKHHSGKTAIMVW
jgi:hypothetical protein